MDGIGTKLVLRRKYMVGGCCCVTLRRLAATPRQALMPSPWWTAIHRDGRTPSGALIKPPMSVVELYVDPLLVLGRDSKPYELQPPLRTTQKILNVYPLQTITASYTLSRAYLRNISRFYRGGRTPNCSMLMRISWRHSRVYRWGLLYGGNFFKRDVCVTGDLAKCNFLTSPDA